MQKERVFTLVEMLVVIAIIGILVSLLMPSLAKSREITKRALCLNNMHQMQIASLLYEDANDGYIALGYKGSYQLNYLYKYDDVNINQGKVAQYADNNVDFLYCPSQTNSQHTYNGEDSKWSDSVVRTSISSAPIAKALRIFASASGKVFFLACIRTRRQGRFSRRAWNASGSLGRLYCLGLVCTN